MAGFVAAYFIYLIEVLSSQIRFIGWVSNNSSLPVTGVARILPVHLHHIWY